MCRVALRPSSHAAYPFVRPGRGDPAAPAADLFPSPLEKALIGFYEFVRSRRRRKTNVFYRSVTIFEKSATW
jgi:hypothetical protein